MAVKFVHHPIPASHLLPSIPTPKPLSLIRRITHKSCRDFISPTNPSGSKPSSTIKVAEQQSYELVSEDTTVAQIKSNINRAVRGINRGIFGIPSVKKSEIEGLVELLESQNPNPDLNQNLEKVDGCWKLIYSTITILGSKRTKLGLRDFISLGDVLQIIDVAKGKAVNVIKFNVRGLNLLNGKLTIEASFKMTSKSRVEITYVDSTITPDQLMSMFQKNYDLLLSIFNPDGWLEITYPFLVSIFLESSIQVADLLYLHLITIDMLMIPRG